MENIVKVVTLIGRDAAVAHDASVALALQQLSDGDAGGGGGGNGGGAGGIVGDGSGGGGGGGGGSDGGVRKRGSLHLIGGGAAKASTMAVVAGALKPRTWSSLVSHGCYGRFVPDTEHEAESLEASGRNRHRSGSGGGGGFDMVEKHSAAVSELRPGENFEQWLRRVTTLGVGTEVNLQLGEFTMKKHRMAQLARDVRRTDEFRAVFERAGGLPPSARVQCAEVQHTTSRAWWRLVGRRHDVQWWLPDVSNASALPVPQHPMGNFAYSPANMCVFIPPDFDF